MASPQIAYAGNVATSSGTWASTTNAVGSTTGNFAQATPAKNGACYLYMGTFNFNSVIPVGAVIGNVVIETSCYGNNASYITCGLQAYVNSVLKGTEVTTTATSATTKTQTVTGLTRDNLLNSAFQVRLRASKGATNTSYYGYFDYVKVTVNYTLPAPTISVTGYDKTKLSHQSGMTSCTVTFQSDLALQAWEARAGGSGQGQGLLVGSGTSLAANTSQQFSVDDTELTNGDLDYRITVYGQNVEGTWSGY